MDENMQLCRICISNSECATMIPIFGEDLLWKKITMLADVKIEKGDTLPQQVCMVCAKSAISACMFKKKCEDADNFFRHHLQMMRKMEHHQRGSGDVITISEGSDNDPNDDNMNVANRHLMTGNNTSLQLMNGNNSSSSVGAGASLDQIDNKSNYDLNSVRLMMNHFLLEQQTKEADAMAAVNGYHHDGGFAPPCDASMDDDQLPLIPEIELITPNDEGGAIMDRQQIVNNQQQGYQCSICYQIFVRKFLLKDHMQSCHGRSPPVYECTNCKKSYLYKRFLEKHIRRGRCVKKRRNQTRPMECTDCHVLFPTGHHLGWHKRTGCPSRASKVPLQQLFKQNIVQYNNFPKPVIPPRKPDNALYMQNRRILPNTSKRKGRTRIKLDATKIALAKILILKEATTTQIAQELDISRTFAWRLRKNLVNGVSLHERFIDPPAEENSDIKQQAAIFPETSRSAIEQVNFGVKIEKKEEIDPKNTESVVEIKQEVQDEEEEDDDDDEQDDEDDSDDDDDDTDSDSDDDDDDEDDDDEDEKDEDEKDEDPNKKATQKINSQCDEQPIKLEQNYQSSYANNGNNRIEQMNYNGVPQTASAIGMPATNQVNMHNESAESDSEDEDGEDNENAESDSEDDEEDEDSEDEEGADEVEDNEGQMQRYKQHLMQSIPSVFHIPQPGFPQPVNLSIKSIQPQSTSLTPTTKKPRKPNVFIDDEKYATAKILVSQNSSTMEIARQLNVSQMTAWKLRDAIVKGIPLSYRSKRETRPKPDKLQKPVASSTPKEKLPRRRLKAADRELRDREITREILEMIKEDSNIQYWKVSAKLAEKGYAISPSSVCQKLKALGIHRRWKPGDKPPILDMDSLKTTSSGGGGGGGGSGVGGGGFGGGTSTDSFEFNNEHQFELGGAHFLSAFTH